MLRSCVGWLAFSVLGAVVGSSCRAWSSGLVSGFFFSPILLLPLFLRRGFDPGHRPKNRLFFRQVSLFSAAVLTIYLAVGLPVSTGIFLFFSLLCLRLLRQMQFHFRRRGVSGYVFVFPLRSRCDRVHVCTELIIHCWTSGENNGSLSTSESGQDVPKFRYAML